MNQKLNKEENDWLKAAWEYMLTGRGKVSICPSKIAWNAYALKCKILVPLNVDLKKLEDCWQS